ncbi:hypothetical protein DPMN_121449 [Dreissena polymorpha]|uniref:Uncharacterized protein n=1 Tax=Dreissena polymorpha TaxID=45954 RepID=A0A9D4GLN3_DREPO|nr:hypothetical protein DPMN_121449 [Dreissena polymorpha]
MGTLLFEVSVNASHDATQCDRLVFIIIILANGEQICGKKIKYSPPPRLPTSSLQGMSAVHDRGRPLLLSPAEEPSQRQFIGQNAVTQILTVLETMRDENMEMKRMLQRLLASSATLTSQCNCQRTSVFQLKHLSKWMSFKSILVMKLRSIFSRTAA